jgi:hypothetical protein
MGRARGDQELPAKNAYPGVKRLDVDFVLANLKP